jgi:hypothetical protein
MKYKTFMKSQLSQIHNFHKNTKLSQIQNFHEITAFTNTQLS